MNFLSNRIQNGTNLIIIKRAFYGWFGPAENECVEYVDPTKLNVRLPFNARNSIKLETTAN